MIPVTLPYAEFCRDEIEVDDMTWLDYIVGKFSGEKWMNRGDVDTWNIDTMKYQPTNFPESYTNLHNQFFEALDQVGYFDDLAFDHAQNLSEEPVFHIDTHCRFDIWTIYNIPGNVDLECGGRLRIEALPEQNQLSDVPPLSAEVPSDVPLIYGPESSIPARPYDPRRRSLSHSRI